MCTAGLFHLCDSIYQASNEVLTDCKAKLAFKTVLMPCEKAQNCGEGNGFFIKNLKSAKGLKSTTDSNRDNNIAMLVTKVSRGL